jgi:protein O-mannosyl-transferase
VFSHPSGNYYRPLVMLLFRINHALFGLKPAGWHAYTLLLHLLATALVFSILRRITERPLVAGVAALVFGVHPVHHEVVAWVSSTTESLCAVLLLAAFLAYLKSRERFLTVWMSISCLAYAAALLAKETALILPGLIFAHACLYGVRESEIATPAFGQRLRQAVLRTSVYVPIAILYMVVRIKILHGFAPLHAALPLSAVLLSLPSVLFFYLRQWLLPLQLSEFYDLPIQMNWNTLYVLLPLTVVFTVAGALWYFRRKMGTRELTLGVIFVALPLLPALSLPVFPPGELVHDRYFYLSSIGASLIVALALQPLTKGGLVFRLPRRLVLVMLTLILPLCYSTANATSYWVNNFILFEHAHNVAPRNAKARTNYALELWVKGDRVGALNMLEGVVRERPEYYLANYNLGRMLYDAHLFPEAEDSLQQARRISPDEPDPYFHLGMIRIRTGRLDEAESEFRQALALRPDDPKLHFALGAVMAEQGNCPVARSEFSQALSLDPKLTGAQEQKDKCGVAAAVPSAGPGSMPVRVPLAPVKGP